MKQHHQPEDQTPLRECHLRTGAFSLAKMVCFALIALVVPLVPLATAEVAANSPSSLRASLDELPSITLATAQRIALRFQDQRELTGEYHISGDGTLSVPVIGRIAIGEMTLEQLEQVLSKRVTEFTGNPTYVTAEIVAYRPVFVNGLVSKPGAVEWYPGMTVLQAETLAGGLYRAPEPVSGTGGLSRIEATRSLRAGNEQQKWSLAALARLRAEKRGAERIEIPPELVRVVGENEAKSLIESQQDLLESRRNSLEKQLAVLKNGIALAKEELTGLDYQSVRLDEQLRKRRDMQERIDALFQKRLIPEERSFVGEMHIAELEEKTTNLAVARARVKGTAAMLEQEYTTLQTDRETSLDAEIAKLEHELAQATIDVEAATASYDRLNIDAKPPLTASPARVVVQYTVVRRNEAEEEKALAETSSYLQPGDVLLVWQGIEMPSSPGKAK